MSDPTDTRKLVDDYLAGEPVTVQTKRGPRLLVGVPLSFPALRQLDALARARRKPMATIAAELLEAVLKATRNE